MKTYLVDSFTHELFKGNPAGVCLLEQALSDLQMLAIAQELGLSETAFIQPLEQPTHFSIRYFSPKMEIPLCGHATLAAAKVVFEQQDCREIHFFNIQNLDLRVQQSGMDIILEFPVYDTIPDQAPPALLAALGIESIKNCAYNAETKVLLLELEDWQVLQGLSPDFEALYRSHDSINGVLVTAPDGVDGYDFHSRYFWPWSGTNEDPVTGGTHTFLTKYWGERLNKTKMRSFQSSKRTGYMEVELVEGGKLLIKSQAVIVLEGDFRL